MSLRDIRKRTEKATIVVSRIAGAGVAATSIGSAFFGILLNKPFVEIALLLAAAAAGTFVATRPTGVLPSSRP